MSYIQISFNRSVWIGNQNIIKIYKLFFNKLCIPFSVLQVPLQRIDCRDQHLVHESLIYLLCAQKMQFDDLINIELHTRRAWPSTIIQSANNSIRAGLLIAEATVPAHISRDSLIYAWQIFSIRIRTHTHTAGRSLLIKRPTAGRLMLLSIYGRVLVRSAWLSSLHKNREIIKA